MFNSKGETPAASIVRSTCAYCGVGCGVDVTVTDGKATGINGSEDHPANFGRLCVKGTHLIDTLDESTRLLTPEVSGHQVSWSEAIQTVADKFTETIAKYGRDAIAFYVSGQLLTEDYYVANKLMKGYIGSGNIDTNSRLCMSSAVSAYKRAFGEDVVPCSYRDLEQTDLLIFIGSNAAWTHPVLYQRIERARQINPEVKLVVIDPRETPTSSGADLFLPIKPGTDGALYNGLLCYLANEEQLDTDYIAQHTTGFEETLKVANEWSLAKVARYCEVDIALIEQFYQWFATHNNAVSMYSMGINQSSSGVDKCHSIINAHLATGKIGREGCGPFSITGQPNAMGGREVGGLANQLTAHLDIENSDHQALVQQFWQSPTIAVKQGAKAVDMFDQIADKKIKAVWIMATNPAVSLPNTTKIKQALSQCDFVVVSDCVANNDTLEFAEVKLPATGWGEKDGIVTNSERRMSRQRASQFASGQARHDWQIICDVAKAMGFDGFNYQHQQEIFTEFAQLTGVDNQAKNRRLFDISGLGQLSIAQYNNMMPIQWPVTTENPQGGEQIFNDGRYVNDDLNAKFYPVVPSLPKQQTSNEFPWVLNTGRLRDQWHSMTRTSIAASLNEHTSKPYVYVSHQDGALLALKDDQIVKVSSAQGSIEVAVKLSSVMRKGQVFIPIHWNKQFAANATVATLFQGVVDPISGQPESKHVGVKIEAIDYQSFGEIYVNNAIKITSEYWLKTGLKHSDYWQLASQSLISFESLQQSIEIAGEWICQSQQGGKQFQFICLQEGQIKIAGYFSTTAPVISQPWIDQLFEQKKLTVEQIQSLLTKQSPEDAEATRKVCSCFSVSKGEVITAIVQGCQSVMALGKALKCGTNCGSCKPELQALLDEHQHEIPIKQLA
ncbi:nitrate reductase [Thalassotalea sp. 1_MG-2023]|uniref:nitrate reductase n=1 Tax=Thalassotalea sp. 1_MG-2023 TaxID=3062680 RepID=UPI0026E18540|nr:nitrate reductase [Thalassotalea sp. 1_MG-2023]MDO6425819.1 nitrate reductase [Thalassotalea sp. 1_MG-2023]